MPQPTDVDQSQNIQLSDAASSQSLPFIGQWNQLISTTNWEKGNIICTWRRSLEKSGVPKAEFSDDAWCQLVGGVTPQHVGRLRRTYDRFGHVFQEYDGVYWSHFYASLDWDDAEMWLEGAVQNQWSVSKMRQHRWETLGKIPADEPKASDIVASELNEENQSLELSENKRQNDRDYIEGPVHEGPDFGDQDETRSQSEMVDAKLDSKNSGPAIRPFESFQDLPDDVMDASNAFKLAIIRHKSGEWSEISLDDMIGLLDALKKLAMTPAQ